MPYRKFATLAVLGAVLFSTVPGLQAATPIDTSGSADSTDSALNPNLATPVVPPLIIIAPAEVRTDPTLAKGCWVRLFPKPNFQGPDDLTVAGPINLPSLHTPAGTDWKHMTESILVGPKATITVYENAFFRDRRATLAPGTREARLRKNLKFTQSIDSLKIACGK